MNDEAYTVPALRLPLGPKTDVCIRFEGPVSREQIDLLIVYLTLWRNAPAPGSHDEPQQEGEHQ